MISHLVEEKGTKRTKSLNFEEMAKIDRATEWLGAWERDSIGLVHKKKSPFVLPSFVFQLFSRVC